MAVPGRQMPSSNTLYTTFPHIGRSNTCISNQLSILLRSAVPNEIASCLKRQQLQLTTFDTTTPPFGSTAASTFGFFSYFWQLLFWVCFSPLLIDRLRLQREVVPKERAAFGCSVQKSVNIHFRSERTTQSHQRCYDRANKKTRIRSQSQGSLLLVRKVRKESLLLPTKEAMPI